MYLKQNKTVKEFGNFECFIIFQHESEMVFCTKEGDLVVDNKEIKSLYISSCTYSFSKNCVTIERTKKDPFIVNISWLSDSPEKLEIEVNYPDKNKQSIA